MTEMDPKTLAADAARVYQESDFENAARLFGEAASAFMAQDSAVEAAEMKNNQSVAYLQAGNPGASYEAASGTASVFARIDDPRREGMAFGNEASALQALGRTNEALDSYRLAAEAFQRGGEDQLRASVMQAIAGIELKQGKFMKALLSMQIGLAGLKKPTLKQKILLALLRFRA